MPFALRIARTRPNLARVIEPSGPSPAPASSRFSFWRGAVLGFVSAMIVFDFFLLGGTTAARVLYGVRYALWFVAHGLHG